MQKKIKNVLIGTSVLGLLVTTTVVAANSTNNINEVNEYSKEIQEGVNNKVVVTTAETILTKEVATTLGWDTKNVISLEDWKTQAPKVVEINGAFLENTLLTTIQIPAQIKTIGLQAFATSMLTNISFEKNSQLTNIGEKAFFNTVQLSTIELPKSLLYLGINSFDSSSISKLTFEIGSMLNTIGANSFATTVNLKNIIVPNSVKVIDKLAFNTTSLETITMPASFQVNGMEYFGFTLVQWDAINWVFPSTTATILTKEVAAKIGWDKKAIITLQDWKTYAPKVVEIYDAFQNNTVLTEIEIIDSVSLIGKTAFAGTTSLTKISMHTSLKTPKLDYGFTENQWKAIVWTTKLEGAILDSKMIIKLGWEEKETINLKDWALIPNVEEITDAFTNNTILTSIEIPGTVVVLGKKSFTGTTSLTKISMSDSLKTAAANYGFTSNQWKAIEWIPAPKVTLLTLKLVKELGWDIKTLITLEDWKELPDILEISNEAFSGNEILTSIEIPSTINVIGETAFAGTTSLTKIIINIKFKTPTPSFGFTEAQWTSVLWTYAPIATTTLTVADLVLIGWENKSSISFEDWNMVPNVVEISGAFLSHESLMSIEIPSRIKIIGDSSFEKTSSLTIVTFDKNSELETIGNNAFADTTILKKINIEFNSKLNSIGDSAFANTTLETIELPNSITTLGTDVFSTTSLTNISMDYSLSNESTTPLYALTESQWNNVIWKNIPTTGMINSFIANQLLKTNLRIDWDKISTYEGISANAFSGTSIVAITIESGFKLDDKAFADTPNLTNIILNPTYQKESVSYGLTQKQWSEVTWFTTSMSYYNQVITIVGSTSAVVALISVALVTYIAYRKRSRY